MKVTWSSEDVVSVLVEHGWRFDRQNGGDAIFVKDGCANHVKVPTHRKSIASGT